MPIVPQPDNFNSIIEGIYRRLSVLENANQLINSNFFDLLTSKGGYMTFLDGSNTTRVEIGNLPVRGASAAQYGLRVDDASGNPIFDTIGLFGNRVMQSLGIANSSGTTTFTSTSFATISGCSMGFSIPSGHPPANIFAPFVATGNVSTNNGNVGFVRASLNGVTTSGNVNFGVLANFASTGDGWIFVTGLAPGSYTMELDAAVNNTPQTFTCFQAAVQVFQLGG